MGESLKIELIPAPNETPFVSNRAAGRYRVRVNGKASAKVNIPGASPGAFDKTDANLLEPHAIHTAFRSPDQAEASFGASDPQRVKETNLTEVIQSLASLAGRSGQAEGRGGAVKQRPAGAGLGMCGQERLMDRRGARAPRDDKGLTPVSRRGLGRRG